MTLIGKMRKNKKGFTLIELIVVIAILAILAIIAIPRLAGFTNSAKLNANENSVATLQAVCNVYEADTGNAPATLAVLQVDKYLGAGVTPKGPKIVTSNPVTPYNAAANQYFVYTIASKTVSIGAAPADAATGFVLSAVSSN